MTKSVDLTATKPNVLLQQIAESVVEGLKFKASMVSIVDTHDDQEVLSVRAFAYRTALSKLTFFDVGKKLQGTILEVGQSIAGQQLIGNYVFLDEMDNLGVRAISEGQPFVRTRSLYDLFAKRVDRETAEKLQALAQLNTFVTMPFRDDKGKLVGNLFAGTEELEITDREIQSLKAFSKMATIAIQNERLLQESEFHVKEIEALHRESEVQLTEVERRNAQLQALQETVSALLESTLSEHRVLQRIVDSVVEVFDFRAAFLSVIEHDKHGKLVLPVRTFSIHSGVRGGKILKKWQGVIGRELVGASVDISEERKKDNLGVKVILDKEDSGRTSELRDLWYPAATPLQCAGVQQALKMKAFATIPFWLIDQKTGEKEPIGNLYVGTGREEITDDEIEVLRTFALQASNAIRNAELYLDAQRIAAMGSLTSNMAHRLNGIIGKVGAWVQQIQGRVERDKLDDAFIQRMTDSLIEAADIVRRLRERVKEQVEIGSIDVNDAILAALESTDIPHKIKVKKALDKKLPAVMAVRQHLVETFRILISNALDAMGDSGRLTVTSRRIEDFIEVLVEDTGKGISDEIKNRLFVLGVTTKERGLGFGLWWAKTSLNWIEGDIKVKSELGKGSTFTVSIPVPERSTM